MIPQIYLRRGKEESLLRRHPWIFSGAIDYIKAEEESEITEGALVEVYNRSGEFIALGHYQIGSIAVRVLTFEREEIDQAWWNRRVAVAYDVRRTLSLTDSAETTCYRLIHGEGDSLPGLVTDIYGTTAVIQCHSVGMYRSRQQIAEAIRTVYGDRITAIYDKSSQTLPFKANLGAVDGYLWGTSDHTSQVVLEHGEQFLVNWEKGQKTGFFLDQKYNRLAVQKLCTDARVLDCFTHTGSFALNAAYAGAKEVIGVDASELGVEQARKNAALNGLENVASFVCEDVFELLPRLEKEGEKFDVVILDPPAFTKSRNSIKNAIKGYREINLRGMKLVKDGGYLATCSCSHYMNAELFAQTIGQAARAAHCRLRQVEFRTQSPDHPILWSADESYYLKFYIFQVCHEH